ncbi:Peroxiredoxin [Albimonas donghaensis]|uniref:Peroxiredoxin n=1 Tax=Albimonas donghaensis TaxID=356660 RepID=A0A1H2XAM6_9RHOB|nr:peroxiredoxin-like family protein [Albimonas donghaensis]SDW89890.1 Peroxiredoxin [Albimonas donghaensis]
MPRLAPGSAFPDVSVPRLGGGTLALGRPAPDSGRDWAMLVVYRGKHCPICARYLKTLETLLPRLHGLGVDVATVSADPLDKAEAFAADNALTLPVGHDLSPEQMAALGLWISDPRSPQETDRPFPEPAVFVTNAEGRVQILDISNAPFARPDLESLTNGIAFVREKGYPIRGTHAA